MFLGGAYLLGSPPFAPTDFTELALWLKADVITANNGDAIQTWNDSSGNGKHAVQATAGARPVFTNAVAAINNKPSLFFDGSDDWTEVASLALDSHSTVFVVCQQYTGHPAMFWLEHGPNANTDNGFFFCGDNGNAWQMRRTTVHSAGGVSDWGGVTWMTATFRYNGSAPTYRRNGTDQANNTVTGSDVGDSSTTASLNIASRKPTTFAHQRCNYAEIIIYNRALSDLEIVEVETYLRGKYAHY